jgi:hypothetical protein
MAQAGTAGHGQQRAAHGCAEGPAQQGWRGGLVETGKSGTHVGVLRIVSMKVSQGFTRQIRKRDSWEQKILKKKNQAMDQDAPAGTRVTQ